MRNELGRFHQMNVTPTAVFTGNFILHVYHISLMVSHYNYYSSTNQCIPEDQDMLKVRKPVN